MAKVPIEITKDEILSQFEICYDFSELEREVFGVFRWKVKLSTFLIKLATWIIGVKAVEK